jgi:SAM-dependent methyltransferase
MVAQMVVEQAYWDEGYSRYALARVPEADATRRLVHRLVPRASDGQTALELGCFPGRYLVELGHLGYRVSGCDTTPRVDTDLAPWLRAQSVAVGALRRGDFRALPRERYDLVTSFGFVEHFPDYADVFRCHFDFVRPGGLVLVTFPNFRGAVQRFLHHLLDRDNLDRHVQPAMRLEPYRRVAERLGTVLFAGYYGRFDFWTDDQRGRNGAVRRQLLRIVHLTRGVWPFVPDASAWSPYAAILVRARG